MGLKRRTAWAAGVATAVAALGLYGSWILGLAAREPGQLLACLDSDPGVLAWHCERALRHARLSPEAIAALNASAGIRLPLYLRDTALGVDLARSMMQQGVDINAPDVLNKRLTALHGAVLSADVEVARTLLALGARVDVLDVDGRTPIDWARDLASRQPEDERRRGLVELLHGAMAEQGRAR